MKPLPASGRNESKSSKRRWWPPAAFVFSGTGEAFPRAIFQALIRGSANKAGAKMGNLRILIVEDREPDAFMITELLSCFLKFEFEITAFASEVRKKMTAFSPHIVLLDLTLTDSEAHETIDQVIPKIAHLVPVLVLTSHDPESVKRSIEQGAIAVVEKTVAVSEPQKFSRQILDAVAEFDRRQTTKQKVCKAQASLLACEEMAQDGRE